jgi:hypothetical protein
MTILPEDGAAREQLGLVQHLVMPSFKGLCKVAIEPTPTFGNALIQGTMQGSN